MPFVQVEAVLEGGWLPQSVFIDAIAIGKILASFFDGLCGSVIGVIAVIAAQILKASVEVPIDRIKDKPVTEAITLTAQVGPAAVLCKARTTPAPRLTNARASSALKKAAQVVSEETNGTFDYIIACAALQAKTALVGLDTLIQDPKALEEDLIEMGFCSPNSTV
ncbi:hypothetical protein QQZ08_012103 [Neonectria magnoliae]|uniref:Uncharacterized protein n=1 Tax=Neonectria magnoliae TaxID=2732573 RepID=A0ABR1H4W2_9HYPO